MSHLDPAVHLCYRFYQRTPVGAKNLMVAVKIMEQDAFVITTFFRADLAQEEGLWPK